MKRPICIIAFVITFCLSILENLEGQVISAGYYHTMAICDNTGVMSCGAGGGQLGDGTGSFAISPVHVKNLTGITAISGGEKHSLFLKSDGTVWACGNNASLQLGDGTNITKVTPIQITSLSNIVAISAGTYYSLFAKSDGTAWGCGVNSSGNLGDGTTTNRATPVQVSGLTNVIGVSANQDHSLFLKSDGTVWACGSNQFGQLGDSSTTGKSTPVRVKKLTGIIAINSSGWHSFFLKNDGTVWACGYNWNGELGNGSINSNALIPVQVNNLSGITAISSNGGHALYLKNDGTVWANGSNWYGQLGNGTNNNGTMNVSQIVAVSNVTAVSAGMYHSLFKKTDGSVWGCGMNYDFELACDTPDKIKLPLRLNGFCSDLTGLKKEEQRPLMLIYPNPSRGTITIELQSNKLTKYQIELIDLMGRSIRKESLSTSSSAFNLQDLPRGMYYVKLSYKDQILETKKIIIE